MLHSRCVLAWDWLAGVLGRYRLTVVLVLAALGFAAPTVPAVNALYAGSSYYNTLYEDTGGEKVASLSGYATVAGWTNCNGTWCRAQANYVNVGWNITDGSSTFAQIFGQHYGYGDLCAGQKAVATVNAGPSYPYGNAYAYFNGNFCYVGYYVIWDWSAGVCDTSDDCYWNTARGPHISWWWSPPGGSATGFNYWWVS